MTDNLNTVDFDYENKVYAVISVKQDQIKQNRYNSADLFSDYTVCKSKKT